ncbi:DUF1707 domain-containing protein [Actinomycetes bacterium KLBMP 9797]
MAARLHQALTDGLLDLTEFDERVRAAYAAKVSADPARLVGDLPAPPPARTLAVPMIKASFK